MPSSSDNRFLPGSDRDIFDALSLARAPLLGGTNESAYKLAMQLERLHTRAARGVDQSQLAAFERDAVDILAQVLAAYHTAAITRDHRDALVHDVTTLKRLSRQ